METWTMVRAKRARTAETPKQPSPGLRLRAPYLYPDAIILRSRTCEPISPSARVDFVHMCRFASGIETVCRPRRNAIAARLIQKKIAGKASRDICWGSMWGIAATPRPGITVALVTLSRLPHASSSSPSAGRRGRPAN
jgi:hypothetical protein